MDQKKEDHPKDHLKELRKIVQNERRQKNQKSKILPYQ
jgi:hypothetical protein